MKVLLAAGEKDVDVVIVDLDNEEEVALNVTLNNPTIQGYFDDNKLGELLTTLEGSSKDLFDSLLIESEREDPRSERQRAFLTVG